MKKIILPVIAAAFITAVAIYAQPNGHVKEDDVKLAQLETLAEQGDTAAMHRLIEFYNVNSTIYVEVEEIIDPDGTEWTAEEVDSVNLANNAETTEHYTERLNYWLEKGIAMNDQIALATKGMRLYYDDEAAAISYLSKAADAGNAQAALFCGSACLNQSRGEEAFKYISLAYELGTPSAGWHLAMCYSAGIGTEPNRDKAVDVMRQAAIMNYPEAVSEMRRIEPDNKMWQHKADSLDITSLTFRLFNKESFEALSIFIPLLVKLLGEGDYLAIGLYKLDGLEFQFGEDGHGFLFGEVLTECFQQQVVVYGDGPVVGIQ